MNSHSEMGEVKLNTLNTGREAVKIKKETVRRKL